ncbi:MAG: prepilin-type N-terminal cleavage/methylation domain-containing protein [Planctomycetes bacterium]|nr:prepilin-type N-terminal cleavage/methylation domain-containing protein [Planctomycetota bacterium]
MRRRSRGMSFLEMAIVTAILAAVLGAIYALLAATIKGDDGLKARVEMQIDAARTLHEITSQLKQSGPTDLDNDGTADLPYAFEDGAAAGGFAWLAHSSPVHAAAPGEPDFGPSAEIAYKLTENVNGFPTDPATGRINWSADTFAIVVVPDAGGVNEVRIRRYDAANTLISDRRVGSYVERMSIETQATTPTLGPNEVRVTLWFRRPDANQKVQQYRSSATLNYRCIE